MCRANKTGMKQAGCLSRKIKHEARAMGSRRVDNSCDYDFLGGDCMEEVVRGNIGAEG
jgi:hypothetical protein